MGTNNIGRTTFSAFFAAIILFIAGSVFLYYNNKFSGNPDIIRFLSALLGVSFILMISLHYMFSHFFSADGNYDPQEMRKTAALSAGMMNLIIVLGMAAKYFKIEMLGLELAGLFEGFFALIIIWILVSPHVSKHAHANMVASLGVTAAIPPPVPPVAGTVTPPTVGAAGTTTTPAPASSWKRALRIVAIVIAVAILARACGAHHTVSAPASSSTTTTTTTTQPVQPSPQQQAAPVVQQTVTTVPVQQANQPPTSPVRVYDPTKDPNYSPVLGH